MRQQALPQCLAALQTGEHQAYGAEHEVGTRAACHAQHLLAIDGQVVAQHAKAKTEGHHVDTQLPPTQEEETVE